MVIGDDHIDRQLVGAPHHFRGANARIHADDQLDALGGRLLHHVGAHPVAVPQAVRNEEGRSAAGHLDGFLQDDDRGGAVHIVIAVDQDLLAAAMARASRATASVMPRSSPGACRSASEGCRKRRAAIGIAYFAGQQNARGGQADAQGRGQSVGLLRVGFGNQPAGRNGHAARQLFEK